MRRALTWIAGLAGIAALGRWAAHRRHRALAPSPPPKAEPAADDPAEELRARLTEQRDQQEVTVIEPDVPEALEARRARVHAKAQEALDEMREPSQ